MPTSDIYKPPSHPSELLQKFPPPRLPGYKNADGFVWSLIFVLPTSSLNIA